MTAPHSRGKKITLLIGDLILIILSTYLAVYIRLFKYVNVLDQFTGATTFLTLTYIVSFYIFDLYNLNCKFKSTAYLTKFMLSILVSTSLIALTFYSLPDWRFGSRGIFLIDMGIITVLVYSWRLLFQFVFVSVRSPEKIIIIGAGTSARAIYDVLKRSDRFIIKGFLDDNYKKNITKIGEHSVIGESSLITEMSKKDEIDSAVIAITHERSSELIRNVLDAKMKGIEIYDMASLYEDLTGKLPVRHLKDSWLIDASFHGTRKNIYTMRMKRLIDIGLSVIGLILSVPIIIITSIAIKLDSKGPVLLRQKRVGYDENVYELLKFRSMDAEAEKDGVSWALDADPRVTKTGKIIRNARIDEIPQMWNVLKGEMSFIGPRPERPEFVRALQDEIPYYYLKHSVKPGITGWAQVNYKYGASKEDALEKLQYELFYIKNLSPVLDTHILLKTIRIVLFGKGAR